MNALFSIFYILFFYHFYILFLKIVFTLKAGLFSLLMVLDGHSSFPLPSSFCQPAFNCHEGLDRAEAHEKLFTEIWCFFCLYLLTSSYFEVWKFFLFNTESVAMFVFMCVF